MDIVDRVAVVTGAGSGLGRATALALTKAGARVAVLDRNTEAARSVADEAGAPTIPVTVDVADRASVTAAIANAVFDALAVRIRDLPITRERLIAAMQLSS